MPRSAHSPLKKQIQAVGATLRQLQGQLRGLVPALARESKTTVARAMAAAKAATPAGPRKLKLSPARRRALKVQGQYLGYMRQLKPGQKAQVKAVKANKGMRVAIAMARRMAGA